MLKKLTPCGDCYGYFFKYGDLLGQCVLSDIPKGCLWGGLVIVVKEILFETVIFSYFNS
jgi:hypothetical protein